MRLVKCNENDLKYLFSKFSLFYPGNMLIKKKRYFNWQFNGKVQSSSNLIEYDFILAIEKSDIKSFVGYVTIPIKYYSKSYKGCYPMNLHAIGSEKGYGYLTINSLFSKYDILPLLDISNDIKKIYDVLKIPMKSLYRWIGFIQPEIIANFYDIGKSTDIIKDSSAILQNNNNSLGWKFVKKLPLEMNFRIEKFYPQIKGYVVRSSSYLNWRYVEIPSHNYKIILSNDNNNLVIYRIEQIKDQPEYSVIRLLEWIVQDNLSQSAISFIIKDGMKHNSILIDFFCTSKSIGSSLNKVGFVSDTYLESEQIPRLFRPTFHAPPILVGVNVNNIECGDEFNFEEWYITKGDGDLDRMKN